MAKSGEDCGRTKSLRLPPNLFLHLHNNQIEYLEGTRFLGIFRVGIPEHTILKQNAPRTTANTI